MIQWNLTSYTHIATHPTPAQVHRERERERETYWVAGATTATGSAAFSFSKAQRRCWRRRCRWVMLRTRGDKLAEECALLLLSHGFSQYGLLRTRTIKRACKCMRARISVPSFRSMPSNAR